MQDNLPTMNNQIAEQILRQLGGLSFSAMTGAKDFVAFKNGIRFKFGRNATSANRCEITLNAYDLYDVRFYRASLNRKTLEGRVKEVALYNSIMVEQLRELFTHATGMTLSIFPVAVHRQQEAK